MNENNVGKKVKLEHQGEKGFIEVITEKQTLEIIKTHKIKISKEILDDPNTEAGLITDNNGKELNLLLLPKDNGLNYNLTDGKTGNWLAISVFSSLYL